MQNPRTVVAFRRDRIPDGLQSAKWQASPSITDWRAPDVAEAAPLMCAGITTFNALRHNGGLPSDLVAVQGIGGLGHLGIQFANKFGYRVAAIGRGSNNATLAKKLGAHLYIDSAATDAAAELQKLGGAAVIL